MSHPHFVKNVFVSIQLKFSEVISHQFSRLLSKLCKVYYLMNNIETKHNFIKKSFNFRITRATISVAFLKEKTDWRRIRSICVIFHVWNIRKLDAQAFSFEIILFKPFKNLLFALYKLNLFLNTPFKVILVNACFELHIKILCCLFLVEVNKLPSFVRLKI